MRNNKNNPGICMKDYVDVFSLVDILTAYFSVTDTYRGADKYLARPGRKKLQRPNSNFWKLLKKKKFRTLSVQPGLCGSNDLRVGWKMATFHFFFSYCVLQHQPKRTIFQITVIYDVWNMFCEHRWFILRETAVYAVWYDLHASVWAVWWVGECIRKPRGSKHVADIRNHIVI